MGERRFLELRGRLLRELSRERSEKKNRERLERVKEKEQRALGERIFWSWEGS